MNEKEIEIPTLESGQNLPSSINVSSTFMPSNVHNILKKKREAKNKNTGKIDFTTILDTDINSNNFLNNEQNQPGSLDINYKEKENQRKGIKLKDNKNATSILCKEIIIISINITSFILFCISFKPLSKYSVIFTYFVYPIDRTSFILLCVNIFISNFIIFFIKIKKISKYHCFYSLLFYFFVFYISHSSSTINKFDKATSIYYVYLFLFIHVFAIFFIIYNYLYYMYLKGALVKTEFLYSLVEYWDSIGKLQKLEKYVNINLDKLITYSSSDKDPSLQKKRQKTKNIVKIFMSFLILIVANILLFIKKKEIFTCDYWLVTNNDNSNICEFPQPIGYCYRGFLNGYFNLNNYKNVHCNFERNPKKEIKNFKNGISIDNNKINTDTKIFAFPLTNNNKYYLKYIENPKKFSQIVNSEIYDYEKTNNKPEVLLDFSKSNTFNGEYPELKINLQKNEQLINSKKQDVDKSLFKNVFMLYLSGVSKNYFNTALPKFNSFINEFLSNNKNDYNLKKMKSFYFNKYHNFGTNTTINLLPMFYGTSKKSTPKNNNNILKYFKDNGYITGQSSDKCAKTELENISINEQSNLEYDHENIAISCDNNYYDEENPYSIEKGPFSIYERCLYGNPMYFYHIEYAKQFWEKYGNNNKKFFKLSLTYGNEKTGSILSYLDEPLYELFFNFYAKGYLDNTIIFIISENGGNLKNILYNGGKYSEAELDIKYGTFILLMSKSENLNLEKYENLCTNKNIMVTPYDIYYSLTNIANGDGDQLRNRLLLETNEKKGISVFKKIDGLKRSCEMYVDDWENDMSCSCISK